MMRSAFARRPRACLVLLAALSLLLLAPAPTTARAQPVAPGLDTVQTAYGLLIDHFYRVPEPAALLAAAWEGAAGELSRAGAGVSPPHRPPLPAERDAAWSIFAAAYPALLAAAPPDLPPQRLAFAAAAAMAASLEERHTAFLSPDLYREFTAELAGRQTDDGLGVIVSARPPWLVTAVAPGSPAQRAGIRPGDTIRAVDDRAAARMGSAALAAALESAAAVRLTLDRPGEGQVSVSVTRGPYSFPDLETRVLPGGTGYIRLRSFSAFVAPPEGPPTIVRALDTALEEFEAAGVTGWVLDLRDNPGGFVATADEIAGRFLADAVTYAASDERGNRGEGATAGRPFRVQRPLTVLVNGGTASSAEMFAAAMQEHGRAPVAGTRTDGAVAGALLFPLPGGPALLIAAAEARTPVRGDRLDETGLAPDVEAADTRTPDDYAAGRDPQLDAAVGALPRLPAPPTPPTPPPSRLAEEAVRARLSRYLPGPADAPPAPLIAAPRLLGDLTFTEPSQYVNALGPVPDARALARTLNERGWQGSLSRFWGETPGLAGPYLGVAIDLYTSEAGAYTAFTTNDAPALQRPSPPPDGSPEGATAYRGAWVSAGTVSLTWRAGRAVATVTYSTVPGQESFEPVAALARLVDARLRASPVPALEPVAR